MGPASSSARHDARRHLLCRAFGVELISDAHERACDLGLPLPVGAKRAARIDRIVQAGLLFVHIPKAAGMSTSQALYGDQVKHASIRLHRRLAGGRLARLPSFAVLRDPVSRFLSAYRYARAGGGASNRVAEPFASRYRRFASIDDALDHVAAARSPYAVDHIFRPQRWYVSDRHGEIAVDRLVTIADLPRLSLLVPGFPAGSVPCLNRSDRAGEQSLSRRQQVRLQTLYAGDFALWRAVANGKRVWAQRSAISTAAGDRHRHPAVYRLNILPPRSSQTLF